MLLEGSINLTSQPILQFVTSKFNLYQLPLALWFVF